MTASSYLIRHSDNDTGIVVAIINGKEIEIGAISNISNFSAKESDNLALQMLKSQDIKIGKTQVLVTRDSNYMVDQKTDLQLVRTKMREIMKALTDKNTPASEKRANLNLYNTINNSAKIIVSACLTEISIDKITPKDIDYIEGK